MDNPVKMDDLGVPPFSETSIWVTVHSLLSASLLCQHLLLRQLFRCGRHLALLLKQAGGWVWWKAGDVETSSIHFRHFDWPNPKNCSQFRQFRQFPRWSGTVHRREQPGDDSTSLPLDTVIHGIPIGSPRSGEAKQRPVRERTSGSTNFQRSKCKGHGQRWDFWVNGRDFFATQRGCRCSYNVSQGQYRAMFSSYSLRPQVFQFDFSVFDFLKHEASPLSSSNAKHHFGLIVLFMSFHYSVVFSSVFRMFFYKSCNTPQRSQKLCCVWQLCDCRARASTPAASNSLRHCVHLQTAHWKLGTDWDFPEALSFGT